MRNIQLPKSISYISLKFRIQLILVFFRHVQTAAALGDVARLMDWVLARMQ